MNLEKLDKTLDLIKVFAESNPRIFAVGLCGSYARGNARPDSDIDLSILVDDKSKFKTTDWIDNFDFEKINDSLVSYKDKVYGNVWSRHVFLKNKTEIEFSFADLTWADTEKIDAGTRKVVSDGFKIIYDPQNILKKLVDKVKIVS